VLPATIKDMYYFLISLLAVGITIFVLVTLAKLSKRVSHMEGKIFELFTKLDDKNYRLWKAKFKAEEKLKEFKKSATINK
jgi:hypothetical protein